MLCYITAWFRVCICIASWRNSLDAMRVSLMLVVDVAQMLTCFVWFGASSVVQYGTQLLLCRRLLKTSLVLLLLSSTCFVFAAIQVNLLKAKGRNKIPLFTSHREVREVRSKCFTRSHQLARQGPAFLINLFVSGVEIDVADESCSGHHRHTR